MLQIIFDIQGQDKVEARLKGLLKAIDTKVILDESAALLLNNIRTRFLSEVDPQGHKWEPSKASLHRADTGRGGGTLYDTGRLYQSIQLAERPPDGRIIGTDVPYAGFVNYGTIRLPERIFMGIADTDISAIVKLITKRVQVANEVSV